MKLVSGPRPAVIQWRTGLSLLALLLPLCGCEHAPSFSILGSFFPAWIFCITAGIVLTIVTRLILLRRRWEKELSPLALIYPSLSIFYACLLWLIFFS